LHFDIAKKLRYLEQALLKRDLVYQVAFETWLIASRLLTRPVVLPVVAKMLLVYPMLRATDNKNSGLVFATRKRTPLDAQNVVNHHFKPLLKHAGLPLSAGTI